MGKYRKIVAQNIERAVKESGLTKAEIARQAKITRTSLDQYLTGEVSPRLDQLERLADALGVELGQFFLDFGTSGAAFELRKAFELVKASREVLSKHEDKSSLPGTPNSNRKKK